VATLEARKISNSVLEDHGSFLSRREGHQSTKKIETMSMKMGKETRGEEFSLLD
jgi:O-acetylhomoserine/O-acetylserine sulfhydrylase-like pyridoxal-dependent enzyme